MGTPVHITGFESGLLDAECVSATGAATVNATAKRNGAYGLHCPAVGTGTAAGRIYAFGANGAFAAFSVATIGVRFYMKIVSLPSSNFEKCFSLLDTGGSAKIYVVVKSDGHLAVYGVGDNLLGTGTTVLSTGTWYRIDVYCETSGSANWAVRVDGSVDASGSGLNTAVNAGSIYLGKQTNRNDESVEYYFDDVRIDSGGYADDGMVLPLSPDGVGTDTAWDSSEGGSSVAADVNTLPWSTGASRYGTAATAVAQTYTIGNITPGYTIGAVAAQIFARDVGSTTALSLRVRSGANTLDLTAIDLGGYAGYGTCMAVEPGSSAAWTDTLLNAIQVGASNTTAQTVRMAGVLVQVDVATAPSGPAIPVIMNSYRQRWS